MTEQEFLDAIEPMRDTDAWEETEDGSWELKDSVDNHREDPGVKEARPDIDSDDHWTDIANPVTDFADQQFITL